MGLIWTLVRTSGVSKDRGALCSRVACLILEAFELDLNCFFFQGTVFLLTFHFGISTRLVLIFFIAAAAYRNAERKKAVCLNPSICLSWLRFKRLICKRDGFSIRRCKWKYAKLVPNKHAWIATVRGSVPYSR